MTETKQKRKTSPLGRLTSFGIKHEYEVPLLLPASLRDYRHVVDYIPRELQEDDEICIAGRVISTEIRFGGAARMVVRLQAASGEYFAYTQFGFAKELEEVEKRLANQKVTLFGKVNWLGSDLWLKSTEVVRPDWVGKLCPVYPGKSGRIGAEKVRERVTALLPAQIQPCSTYLVNEAVGDGSDRERLARVCRFLGVPIPDDDASPDRAIASCTAALGERVYAAHFPNTEKQFKAALREIEGFAALTVYFDAKNSAKQTVKPKWVGNGVEMMAAIKKRAASLPFSLIEEQREVVTELARDLCNPNKPTCRMISGDVGTGKTVVYGLAVAAVLDLGGRVACLMPGVVLAQQIYNDLVGWWPDLADSANLIISDSVPEEGASLFVGTTALLNREIGEIDFVVVDEQHRFSRDQREKLLSKGSHLAEVSATFIPRTQALIKFGIADCSVLTKCHADKTIHTRLFFQSDRRDLFSGVKGTLNNQGQVLVVYPARGDKDSEGTLPTAREGFERWENAFPGQCVLATGGMTEEALEEALDEMRSGRKRILISTIVVEVGVNIPSLEHVVVVHAERMGLITLHQVRGRVARHGGIGYCDLYLPKEVGEDSMKRLSVLVDENSGQRVAERDMELRGFGDLRSKSKHQSGASVGHLFGKEISLDVMSSVINWAEASV